MDRKFLKMLFIVFVILASLVYTKEVFASGNFTVNKSSITITEGKTSSFSINGSNATGRVNIKSSDTSIITVNKNDIWLENSSEKITVSGKKNGVATITVSGTVSDSNGVEATITKNVKVTVNANTSTATNKNTNNTASNNNTTTTKSSNANLSTLGVTPKEYDFSGFSKNKTSYSVTVPSDVDSLKVVYKTEDSKAKVKVSGNSGFDVGSNNNIKVVVTAENGNSKTYTIKVTKLATEEEKPGNVIEDENKGLYLTSLNIEGLELTPEFAQDTYSYTANLGSEDITELKVDATANRKDINIEISGNKELVEGENIINIVG